MNVREWNARRKDIHEAFYEDLVGTARCGPFDGGCVVVAEALHSVIGGEIVVLVRSGTDRADHAAVLLDGKLWDFDGPLAPTAFIRRYERTELCHMQSCSGYRPIRDGDLEEAYRDPDLRDRLSAMFREMLPEFAEQARPPF